MSIKKGDLFRLSDKIWLRKSKRLSDHTIEETMVQYQEEFRPPRRGEWYISGAIPEAYFALNDLTDSYHIGVLVRTKSITTITCEVLK